MNRATALQRHVGNVRRDHKGRYIPRDAWVRGDGRWIIPTHWQEGLDEPDSLRDAVGRLVRRFWTWVRDLGEGVTHESAQRHAEYERMRAECERFWDDIGREG